MRNMALGLARAIVCGRSCCAIMVNAVNFRAPKAAIFWNSCCEISFHDKGADSRHDRGDGVGAGGLSE